MAQGLETFDWTGFYFGVHAGYSAGTDDVISTLRDSAGVPYLPSASNAFSVQGGVGGVQAGYDYQINDLVLGIEGDYSWSGSKGEFQFDQTRDEAIAGGSLDYLASLRGKLGLASGHALFYATGGVAFGGSSGFANNVFDLPPTIEHATGESQLVGYVIGAGVEYALTDNLSIRGEYLQYNFAQGDYNLTAASYPAGSVLQVQPTISLGVVRGGLNFRF